MFTHKIIESLTDVAKQYDYLASMPEHLFKESIKSAASTYNQIKPPNQVAPHTYLDFKLYGKHLRTCIGKLSNPCFLLDELPPLDETIKLISAMKPEEFRLPFPEMTLLVKLETRSPLALLLKEENKSIKTDKGEIFDSIITFSTLVYDQLPTKKAFWEIHNIEGCIIIDENEQISVSGQLHPFARNFNKVATPKQKAFIEDSNSVFGCYISTLIALLSCKNIIATKIPAPHKLNKSRRKKNKLPIASYHVLNLKTSTGQTLPLSGKNNTNGVALHLRRGHFQTYWTGKGRKTPTRLWVAPYYAGNPDNGIALKDYKV